MSKTVAISTEFELVIMKALELKPENRPSSAKEMLSLLLDRGYNQVDTTEFLQSYMSLNQSAMTIAMKQKPVVSRKIKWMV